jgi:hypothetical protein
MILEGSSRNNVSVVRPHWRVPFPLFDEARCCIKDHLAQAREHLAAPTGSFVDVAGNLV